MQNTQWLLTRYPQGTATAADFKVQTVPVPEPGAGEVLVRNVYLFLAPSTRLWMGEKESYLPPPELGTVMRGLTLGVVEQSNSPAFAPGDIVNGFGGWQQYFVSPAEWLAPVKPKAGVPLAAYRTVTEVQGLTAYVGLVEICQPRAGQTLVVTAAAGSVGGIACEIGKLLGMRVIGIAGGAEKCRWLLDVAGVDGAIDYRTEDVASRLDALCPDGIDRVFENVGGPTFDLLLQRLNERAVVALCGMIADYNDAPYGLRSLMNVVNKSARIEGFLCRSYFDRMPEIGKQLEDWMLAGKLHCQVDMMDGIENALTALNRVFAGQNRGAQFVRLSPEPV